MAITYHNLASTPADTGSNSTSPTAITPPGSMSSGDLVVVVCGNRLKNDTHAVSNNGGQSWTKLTTYGDSGTFATLTWFYCTYDGTWDANPSFSHGGTNNTCVMLVFRPTSVAYAWSVDIAEAGGSFAAPGSPYDVTITGITAGSASVAIAAWFSSDDNTWAYQSGTSWTQPTGGTVNNMAGSDTGTLVAYRLMPSGGSTGSPVGRETTNGGDPGMKYIMSFKETLGTSKIYGNITGAVAAVTGVIKGKSSLVGAIACEGWITGTFKNSAFKELYRVHESTEPDYYHFGMFDCSPITKRYVAACRLGTAHVGAGDYGKIYVWRSDDGTTWSTKEVILSQSGQDYRGNAGGYLASGRMLLFSGLYDPDPTAVWICEALDYSDNDGVSWTGLYTDTFTGGEIRVSFGKVQELSDGDLIIGAHALQSSNYEVGIRRSTNGGTSWTWETVANTGATYTYCEPSVLNLGSDNLLFIARIYKGTTYHQWFSSNGGTSWTDQGATTFDSWTSYANGRERPPSLDLIEYRGFKVVACYYADTTERLMKVIYGKASDFASLGVSAWNTNTKTTLATLNTYGTEEGPFTRDGYQHVAHKPGHWVGRGTYYNETVLNGSDIVFFATPANQDTILRELFGLKGVIGGVATVTGTVIQPPASIVGTSDGVATVTGALVQPASPIAGTADGVAGVTGVIQASGALIGTIAGVAVCRNVAYYYIKNGGSDSADGLSDTNAWANLSKAEAATLYPGDKIMLKCGSTWTTKLTIPASGASTRPIVIKSYDSGNKPIIKPSLTLTGWTGSGPVYTRADTMDVDMLFEDGLPLQIATTSACTDGYWFRDTTTHYYKPTSGVPGDHVTTVTYWNFSSSYSRCGIVGNNKKYITVDGIAFKEAWASVCFYQSTVAHSNILVQNCDFSYSFWGFYSEGDGIYYGTVKDNYFYRVECGTILNSLTESGEHHNWTFTGNTLEDVGTIDGTIGWETANGGLGWDMEGLTAQNTWDSIWSDNTFIGGFCIPLFLYTHGTGASKNNILTRNRITSTGRDAYRIMSELGAVVDNNSFYNNIIDECGTNSDESDYGMYAMTFVYNSTEGNMNYVYNNTIRGGHRWMILSSYQQADQNATRITIKNNLVMDQDEWVIDLDRGADPTVIINNNLYYNLIAEPFYMPREVDTTKTFAEWQSITGYDADSVYGSDPKLWGADDFHLRSDSPAINEGVDVDVDTDFDQHARIGLPDIGAYEFIGATQGSTIAGVAGVTGNLGIAVITEPIAGVSDGVAIVTGNLLGKGDLNAPAIEGVATVAGTLAQEITEYIAGASDGVTTAVTGLIHGHGDLSAPAIAGSVTVVGVILAKGDLNAPAIAGVATVEASISYHKRIYGTSDGATTAVTGVILAKGDLSAPAIAGVSTVTGLIKGKGDLSAPAITGVTTAVTGLVKGKSSLACTIAGVADVLGDVYNSSPLGIAGEANGLSTVTGLIKAKGALVVSLGGVATVTGVINGAVNLYAPTITGVATAVADLKAGASVGQIEGTSDSVATATGLIKGKGTCTGVVAGLSTVTGAIVGEGDLSAPTIVGTASTVGLIKAKGDLNAPVVAGVSTVQGNAINSTPVGLAGQILCSSTVTGAIKGKGTLAVSFGGVATVSGTVFGKYVSEISGLIEALSIVGADLNAEGELAGLIQALSTSVANVKGKGTLRGLISALSTTTVNLQGIFTLAVLINGGSTMGGVLKGVGELLGVSGGATEIVRAFLRNLGEGENLEGLIAGLSTARGNLKWHGYEVEIIYLWSRITNMIQFNSTITNILGKDSTITNILEIDSKI